MQMLYVCVLSVPFGIHVEYHDEWYALKSPSIRVSVIVIRWSREGR